MTSSTSKITVIEDFRDKDGGPVIRSLPDFHQPIYPTVAEFIYKASKVLSEFRDEWILEHANDGFAKGLEIDVAPVMTDGMIMGFMTLSEVDGVTYDYVPTQTVEEDK